jgi:hypothetical protein
VGCLESTGQQGPIVTEERLAEAGAEADLSGSRSGEPSVVTGLGDGMPAVSR